MTHTPYPPSQPLAGLKWLGEPVLNRSYYGDVWYTAWADNGNLYAVADDTWGCARTFPQTTENVADDTWGPEFSGSNLAIYQIDGAPPNTTIQLVNKMQPYGHATCREAGASWKAHGLTCVH